MKANHVPVEKRLQARIWGLQSRLDSCWKKTGKRFYQFCKHCDLDIISVNMHGHSPQCPVKGHEAQIKHFQGLLAEVKK